MSHRSFIVVPFALMFAVVLVGGAINTVGASGTIVDASTDLPVAHANVNLGNRSVGTADDGSFDLGLVPRTASLKVQAAGYAPLTIATTGTEVRLQPATLTLQVDEARTNPPKGVPNPQVRLGTTVVGSGGPTGSVVVVPYPPVGAQLLICAEGFDIGSVEARGITREVTLSRGDLGCPPLPSPSPAPTVSPSPTVPAPTPTPSP